MRRLVPGVLALVAFTAACSSGGKSSGPRTVFGGNRPVTLQIPASYDGTTAMPLMLLLHGYSVDGQIQQAYFGMNGAASTQNMFILAPDGLIDSQGNHYWNATDACCAQAGTAVDDVAYLTGLVHDVEHDYKIDPKRVYAIGHSNGGFMAHRLACDASVDFAAILSLAGATWLDQSHCTPTDHVSVLQVHGTLDDEVEYAGLAGIYPGAVESVTDWQVHDGCTAGLVPGDAAIDLDSTLTLGTNGDPAETTKQKFDGCPTGFGVELWTINGDGHIPTFTANWATSVFAWLAAHPKP